MPKIIEIDGVLRSVATEDELLAFANDIRQAGGAGVLEALLPAVQGDPDRCLLANALNFGCSVEGPFGEKFADGSYKWTMHLPHNLTDEQCRALGRVKGVRLRFSDNLQGYYLTLPKHIGNAALAFDLGAAFQSYTVSPGSPSWMPKGASPAQGRLD